MAGATNIKFSTFGESSAPAAAIEQAATNTTETAAEATNGAEKSETVVTNKGELATNTEAAKPENTETAAAETNSFDLKMNDFGEQAANTSTAEKPQQITDWKEAIKKADRKELLKELGFSDFAVELNEHIAKGGKPIDYLNAKAIDWNTMPDVDVVLNEMKKEFPDATPTQLQRLFNKRYSQLESVEDEDKEDGLLLMKAAARQIKATRIAEQQSFKIPEQQVQTQMQQQLTPEQIQAQKAQQIAATQQQLLENEAIKNLMQSKRVAIQLGKADSFNFNIDKPELVIKAIADGDMWKKLITNEQGAPDMQKLVRLTKYLFDMDGHDTAIFNYGKSKGLKEVIEEGQNARKPTGTAAKPAKTTQAEAWKNAKVSTYGAPVNSAIN